ncbi:ketoacyl-ACP synthase III [bacterium]|nr:ketoacyl-ACP synthase III [bacterium]
MNQLVKSKIEGIGKAIPSRVLTNFDLEKMVDTSDEWIIKRTGIRERRILAEDELCSDLAVKASLSAIENAGLTPADIDLIMVATVTPDMPFPSTACLVQSKIGARDIPAYDFSAGCTGFIYGLIMADNFLKTKYCNHVLLVGVEILSRIVDWEDRSTCVLFGDAAGAVVVGNSNNDSGVLSTYMSANGSLADLLYMPGGGSKFPATKESVENKLHCLKMEGNEVFKAAVNAMKESALVALDRANIKKEQVDWLIPHQANIRIIDFLRRSLKMPEEKVVVTIDKLGNTSAASVPTAMAVAVEDGRIKEGDLVLLVAFGAGFTWGSVLLRW